jgi:hypothetical protein
MSRQRILQLIAISVLAAGCATTQPCTKPAIARPLAPALPSIPPGELKCVSDKTYATLIERELRLREHAEDCMVLLKGLTSER